MTTDQSDHAGTAVVFSGSSHLFGSAVRASPHFRADLRGAAAVGAATLHTSTVPGKSKAATNEASFVMPPGYVQVPSAAWRKTS
ncbi:hypothetical protein [Symbioplanes lichenis]|uniref:hypothetical protein n=1 Tax=Symbioplanes lichenis TaxID=1629072 RepID=UPI002738D8F1|nr:hypothetical protein [Actinoplanes lichenis]